MAPVPSSRLTVGLRLLLGLLGAVSFVAGSVAVFVTQNGTGSAVLLGFGGILMVLAILGNRIESFEFGGTKLRLSAAAAERFALAAESERRGDTAAADQLRAEAQALLDAAGPIAADYRSVRGSMRSGPERVRRLEEVVARARRLAEERSFDPAEVARWLREGHGDERITALGMMQARPSLRDFDAILAAAENSMSAFEQYQAMLLLERMIDGLEPGQRERLAGVVGALQRARLRRDGDRFEISERILRRLE